jgi:hypothetical protein
MKKNSVRNYIKLCVDYNLRTCVAGPYKDLLGKRGISLRDLGINNGSGFFQSLGPTIGMEFNQDFLLERQQISIARLIDEITKEYKAQKQTAQLSLPKKEIISKYHNIPPMTLKQIKKLINGNSY